MNQDMIAALRELEREKGIAFETILEGLEEAMASAYKSWWKQQHPELDEETFGVRAKIDPENGDLRVWEASTDWRGARLVVRCRGAVELAAVCRAEAEARRLCEAPTTVGGES